MEKSFFKKIFFGKKKSKFPQKNENRKFREKKIKMFEKSKNLRKIEIFGKNQNFRKNQKFRKKNRNFENLENFKFSKSIFF